MVKKSLISEIKMGIKIEKEHSPTIRYIKNHLKTTGKLPSNTKIYRQIALNHLREDPLYYIKLKKAKL